MRAAMIICHSFVLMCAVTTSAFAAGESFVEACDGSAIVSVGEGYFLNATDEDNTIRLYKIGTSSPVARFPLNDFLKTEVSRKTGKPKEADIEAVAKVETRLYWIASHSRDKKGDLEVSRFKFFATDLSGQGATTEIAPVGDVSDTLLAALTKLDTIGPEMERAAKLAPAKGGLNIEGLAPAAGGQMLIGFRGPLIGEKALVVPLRNPAAVVEKREPPSLGTPIHMDLGGSGIRAIEPQGPHAPDSYWILAGPLDGAAQSTLYSWKLGEQPIAQQVDIGESTLGFGEALMADGTMRYVGFDAGEIGDPQCKDTPIDQRSFTVRRIDG